MARHDRYTADEGKTNKRTHIQTNKETDRQPEQSPTENKFKHERLEQRTLYMDETITQNIEQKGEILHLIFIVYNTFSRIPLSLLPA